MQGQSMTNPAKGTLTRTRIRTCYRTQRESEMRGDMRGGPDLLHCADPHTQAKQADNGQRMYSGPARQRHLADPSITTECSPSLRTCPGPN